MSKKSFDLSQDSTDENPVVEYSTPISPSENVEEKQKKADDITVTISDRSPVVLLFGAGSSGKTMTLIRLTRWLRDREYQVNPIENFHESNQGYYQSLRDQFDDTVNSDYAAAQTGTVNFMLIMVRNKYGEPICQILEAPGEHYFRKDAPKAAFPTYISTILQRNNPKTWVFIVERYWKQSMTG